MGEKMLKGINISYGDALLIALAMARESEKQEPLSDYQMALVATMSSLLAVKMGNVSDAGSISKLLLALCHAVNGTSKLTKSEEDIVKGCIIEEPESLAKIYSALNKLQWDDTLNGNGIDKKRVM